MQAQFTATYTINNVVLTSPPMSFKEVGILARDVATKHKVVAKITKVGIVHHRASGGVPASAPLPPVEAYEDDPVAHRSRAGDDLPPWY